MFKHYTLGYVYINFPGLSNLFLRSGKGMDGYEKLVQREYFFFTFSSSSGQ